MERVLIIGGNGCGKTTFAKKLSEKSGLPLVHLDALYWGDHWTPVVEDEFDRRLSKVLITPKWILDGNIVRTLPLRLEYCDTVIFMDFSRWSCLWGAVKRILQNYGRSRPDMGGDCPEVLDWKKLKFIWGVWSGHKQARRKFYQLLCKADGVTVVQLKNRRQAERFLQGL